jgi:diguanylate cyclase (GGDEF)-like protein
VVEEIKKNIRKSDFLMRYGGDEFVIVFYDIRKQHAESIFERVLSELERIKEEENHLFDMHFSYGIWMHDGNETELPEAVIVQADREMYKKKMGYKSENKKAWSMATAQIQTPLPKKSMEI